MPTSFSNLNVLKNEYSINILIRYQFQSAYFFHQKLDFVERKILLDFKIEYIAFVINS